MAYRIREAELKRKREDNECDEVGGEESDDPEGAEKNDRRKKAIEVLPTFDHSEVRQN